MLPHLVRDVGREFDDLDRTTVAIGDGIVGRLNEDLAALLSDPLELAGLVDPAPQAIPEGSVGLALDRRRIDEHAVMATSDLLETVAEGIQEFFVGGQDRAVELELDHALRLPQRLDLSLVVHREPRRGRDIRRDLHDLHGLAAGTEDRIVRGLDVEEAAILAEPFELGLLEATGAELSP